MDARSLADHGAKLVYIRLPHLYVLYSCGGGDWSCASCSQTTANSCQSPPPRSREQTMPSVTYEILFPRVSITVTLVF